MLYCSFVVYVREAGRGQARAGRLPPDLEEGQPVVAAEAPTGLR